MNSFLVMDLPTFLEENWFMICLFVSFGSFLIRTTRKFDKYTQTYKDRDYALELKLNNIKDEIKIDVNSKFDDVNDEIQNIKAKLEVQESIRADSLERTRIIMQGVEATLHSLHDDGHNGPVTISLRAMEEYKLKKSVQ